MGAIAKPAITVGLFLCLAILALAFTAASSSGDPLTIRTSLIGEDTTVAATLAAEGGRPGAGADVQYFPVGPVEFRLADAIRSRMLAPFQECRDCRCCQKQDPNACATMQCCYTLQCNIPGKPAGTCVVAPKACNCNGCT